VCHDSSIDVIDAQGFRALKERSFDAIFMPWLPPRKLLMSTFALWLKNGRPNVYWIDHNPVAGRDKRGFIIRALNYKKFSKVHKLEHSNSLEKNGLQRNLGIPHPVLCHAFENLPSPITYEKAVGLRFAFIGRLDDQKGISKLPGIAMSIAKEFNEPTYWKIAGNNSNVEYVKSIVRELENIPNVHIESHIFGKNCPQELLRKALADSNFLLAPYARITASGTFALALACSTEIISLSEDKPIGLPSFLGTSIHCIDSTQLIKFLKTHKEAGISARDLSNKIESHNTFCREKFLEILYSTSLSTKRRNVKQ
jgi:glycosyltransferase involved in cell wall biosynthesis